MGRHKARGIPSESSDESASSEYSGTGNSSIVAGKLIGRPKRNGQNFISPVDATRNLRARSKRRRSSYHDPDDSDLDDFLKSEDEEEEISDKLSPEDLPVALYNSIEKFLARRTRVVPPSPFPTAAVGPSPDSASSLPQSFATDDLLLPPPSSFSDGLNSVATGAGSYSGTSSTAPASSTADTSGASSSASVPSTPSVAPTAASVIPSAEPGASCGSSSFSLVTSVYRTPWDDPSQFEYLVKYHGVSYLHCEWLTECEINDALQNDRPLRTRFNNFIRRIESRQEVPEVELLDCQVERVVDCSDVFRALYPAKAAEINRNEWPMYCLRIIDALVCFCREHRFYGTPFLRAVDEEKDGAIGYYQLIKTPMDFGTVLSKLYLKLYNSPQEFWADTKLIFSNCSEYNKPITEISTQCRLLEALFDKLYHEWATLSRGGGTPSDSSVPREESTSGALPFVPLASPSLTVSQAIQHVCFADQLKEPTRRIKYLVKWKGRSYREMSWELQSDISDKMKIAQYHRHVRVPEHILDPRGPGYRELDLQRRMLQETLLHVKAAREYLAGNLAISVQSLPTLSSGLTVYAPSAKERWSYNREAAAAAVAAGGSSLYPQSRYAAQQRAAQSPENRMDDQRPGMRRASMMVGVSGGAGAMTGPRAAAAAAAAAAGGGVYNPFLDPRWGHAASPELYMPLTPAQRYQQSQQQHQAAAAAAAAAAMYNPLFYASQPFPQGFLANPYFQGAANPRMMVAPFATQFQQMQQQPGFQGQPPAPPDGTSQAAAAPPGSFMMQPPPQQMLQRPVLNFNRQGLTQGAPASACPPPQPPAEPRPVTAEEMCEGGDGILLPPRSVGQKVWKVKAQLLPESFARFELPPSERRCPLTPQKVEEVEADSSLDIGKFCEGGEPNNPEEKTINADNPASHESTTVSQSAVNPPIAEPDATSDALKTETPKVETEVKPAVKADDVQSDAAVCKPESGSGAAEEISVPLPKEPVVLDRSRPASFAAKSIYADQFASMKRPKAAAPGVSRQYPVSPVYKGNRKLFDYQLQGLNWLLKLWASGNNGILADEMGLGKTVQTMAFLWHLFTKEKMRGPFLVVAPLSTLDHWRRTAEDWTDFNGVLYYDEAGRAGRDALKEVEWFHHMVDWNQQTQRPQFTLAGAAPLASGKANPRIISTFHYKFQLLLTSYEIFASDAELLIPVPWQFVVVDEAHRLKNRSSKTLQLLKQVACRCTLLLTGTPVQNNTEELWPLLNYIEPVRFCDLDAFKAEFGDLQTNEQVQWLTDLLRPHLLRRVKEDVAGSIPPIEETIIDVELTILQKAYYKAIFERNKNFLFKNARKGQPLPSLMNIEMELRKCCNHPFMIQGVEQRELAQCKTEAERFKKLVESSGKLVLLGKLLPKLRAENHKVLIFSQFQQTLSLIQDFLAYNGWDHERLDGQVKGTERSGAIARFNDPNLNKFVFLLSTRAGGLGINLTSADTVIIFDSDWNPQNDIQATARAHRIGQEREVKVYRLVTARTYEADMFDRASKKLGLNTAVFHRGAFDDKEGGEGGGLSTVGEGGSSALSTAASSKAPSKEEIEELLKKGAFYLLDKNPEAARQFQEGDIEEILTRSSRLVRYQITGTSSSFAKTSFRSDKASDLSLDDPDFWQKVLNDSSSRRLLARLNDGSATQNDEAMEAFMIDLQAAVEGIAAEDDPEPVIEALVQMSNLTIFSQEHREQAQSWLTRINATLELIGGEGGPEATEAGGTPGSLALADSNSGDLGTQASSEGLPLSSPAGRTSAGEHTGRATLDVNGARSKRRGRRSAIAATVDEEDEERGVGSFELSDDDRTYRGTSKKLRKQQTSSVDSAASSPSSGNEDGQPVTANSRPSKRRGRTRRTRAAVGEEEGAAATERPKAKRRKTAQSSSTATTKRRGKQQAKTPPPTSAVAADISDVVVERPSTPVAASRLLRSSRAAVAAAVSSNSILVDENNSELQQTAATSIPKSNGVVVSSAAPAPSSFFSEEKEHSNTKDDWWEYMPALKKQRKPNEGDSFADLTPYEEESLINEDLTVNKFL